jgi:hypothetical protein
MMGEVIPKKKSGSKIVAKTGTKKIIKTNQPKLEEIIEIVPKAKSKSNK